MGGVGGKICRPSPEGTDSATVCLSALPHPTTPCFRTRQGLLLPACWARRKHQQRTHTHHARMTSRVTIALRDSWADILIQNLVPDARGCPVPGVEALRRPGGATALLKSCSGGVMPVCCLVLPGNDPLCHKFLEHAGSAAGWAALGGQTDDCRMLTPRSLGRP